MQRGAVLLGHRGQRGGGVLTQASTASTMPKQWYSGTGMHSASCSLKRIAIAMKRALFTTLWCVSVAAKGQTGVPLVNWILIG